MKFKLNVQKYIENPNYEEDMKNYLEERKNRYGYGNSSNELIRPEKFISTTSLEVELTEEEYTKLKGEVIKIYQ